MLNNLCNRLYPSVIQYSRRGSIMLVLVSIVSVSACSSEGFNRFAYGAAANHQCMEDNKHNPSRELNDNTICPGNDKIEGATYEEYQERRKNQE